MFNKETVLTRLRNGEDAQVIANEMAELVNEAIKEVQEQKKKEEAALREKEKVAELNAIVEDFGKWLIKHYEIDEPLGHIDTKEIIETIDELVKNLKALAALDKKIPVKKAPVKKEGSLEDFIKQMGW